ncbi:MAG: hypothetical protein JXJ17_13695 [Anaerolineae bacterium]|nr:hypothetical protein [Anaerolineae bacterium]
MGAGPVGATRVPADDEYRQKIAPDAQAFLITIAPYRKAIAPPEASGIHYIYGWSETVLTYIRLTINGLAGQVEAIREMEL